MEALFTSSSCHCPLFPGFCYVRNEHKEQKYAEEGPTVKGLFLLKKSEKPYLTLISSYIESRKHHRNNVPGNGLHENLYSFHKGAF